MEINEFIESLGNYLSITGRIVEREGGKIDVGEEFTLRVVVRNTGRRWYPFINFRNVVAFVNRGEHARPANGERVRRNVDDYLRPGEARSFEIQMVAINELSWWDDIWNAEEIASISVSGNLDADSFFQANNRESIRLDF